MRYSHEIDNPTYYIQALHGEFADWAFSEQKAEQYRGLWRDQVFGAHAHAPLDLEIGTGNGFFFAHRALLHPERNLVGLELKFKPLIQAIRRARKQDASNMRIVRYDAEMLRELFVNGELNNIFIHHPDPWTKRRKQKNRLLKTSYLTVLHELQRPGSFLEFKTDSESYFRWAVEEFKRSPYQLDRYSENLHHSDWSSENFVTHFERIYRDLGQPIYYLRAQRE